MKQTAVEWLYGKMFEKKSRITKEEYDQAKQMEKEQMYNFWDAAKEADRGEPDEDTPTSPVHLYEETYGKETKKQS